MSFKRESMPSINESDNEEEENLSNSEEISTSDYSSLNRQKNATLTKAMNELMDLKGSLVNKTSTLKLINDTSFNLNNQHITDDNKSNNSEISEHYIEIDKTEIIDTNNQSCPGNSESDYDIKINAVENGSKDIFKNSEKLEIDRFGFLKSSSNFETNSEINIPIQVIRTRERKWQDMLNKWNDYKSKKYKKMVNRCRKGIPQSMRCKAWQYLCSSRCLENTMPERMYYKEQSSQLKVPKRKELSRLSFRNSTQAVNSSDNDSISVLSFYSTVQQKPECPLPMKSLHHDMYENYKRCTPNVEVVDQIRKDIYRQFPNHENFMLKGGLGQESLSTILTVYSIRHPETGYCQGMAPLAAALLMVMPEEDAFWTFDKICDSYIPGYYDVGLKQIQIDAKALTVLLKKESPHVYNYMCSNQIDPICYMVDWFMCIYIRTLPWPSVLQVMDMFLCEGKSILFKVALVLIIGAMNPHSKNPKDGQESEILAVLRNLTDDITTPKYITSHISKLTVTKTDIKRECQNQETLMAKARAKSVSKR